MIVATFFMSPLSRTEVKSAAALSNWSFGIPVIRSTISGVYREYCCLRSWKPQGGCWMDGSYATLAGSDSGVGAAEGVPGCDPPPLGSFGCACDSADPPPPLALAGDAAPAACPPDTRPPAS